MNPSQGGFVDPAEERRAYEAAKDRRISRLSLISSAANLYSEKIADPQLVLAAAQMWESWIYGDVVVTNGTATVTSPAPAPASSPSGPVCDECGQPLTEVAFKTGKTWTVQQLADFGMAKYGKALCKQHYFGKKATV
jgi:hypothetical protein